MISLLNSSVISSGSIAKLRQIADIDFVYIGGATLCIDARIAGLIIMPFDSISLGTSEYLIH